MLLYASMNHDIPVIVNISGRFALERGIDGRLGKNFMQRIKKDGYIDVRNRKGRSCLGYMAFFFSFFIAKLAQISESVEGCSFDVD